MVGALIGNKAVYKFDDSHNLCIFGGLTVSTSLYRVCEFTPLFKSTFRIFTFLMFSHFLVLNILQPFKASSYDLNVFEFSSYFTSFLEPFGYLVAHQSSLIYRLIL